MLTGLLLTGGSSTRMGRDKANLVLGGQTLAARAASALTQITDDAYVVGPEAGSGLSALADRSEGPLAAIADAWKIIGGTCPTVVVLACDIPFVDVSVLESIVSRMGSAEAVIPTAAGRDQPLCAAYGAGAMDQAVRLVAAGERSMRALVASLQEVVRLPEGQWRRADSASLDDVDTPDQWEDALRSANENTRNV